MQKYFSFACICPNSKSNQYHCFVNCLSQLTLVSGFKTIKYIKENDVKNDFSNHFWFMTYKLCADLGNKG